MTRIKHIPFNQGSDLINQLDYKEHTALLNINDKHGGLCELVCNRILIDDSMGKEDDLESLKNRITVERMHTDEIEKSHLLTVYSCVRRFFAFLFNIYPDNHLNILDQWRLVQGKSVNKPLLKKALSNMQENETSKLEVFCKTSTNFQGHSLLVKKKSNKSFIFFDPNHGEYRGVSFKDLKERIEKQIKMWDATDICLIKGDSYLDRLHRQKKSH